MKKSKFTTYSNLIIMFILMFLLAYTDTINTAYVFNYENEKVIYNGNRDSNKVSLMFNVYWGSKFIEGILDVLKEYNVKTTFFVGGIWVEKEVDMLKDILAEGHEIGNHGYLHKDQDKMSYEQNYEEINTTHQLVKVYTGVEMNLFAPPSGAFNNATLDASSNLGYATIMWSKDTIDWRDQNANLIFSRATNKVKGGDLILMHPTKSTLQALPTILEYYKLNNIEVNTVSSVISIE